jgi:hypothetical protein
MTRAVNRNLGLASAIGAFLWPILITSFCAGSISSAWETSRLGVSVAVGLAVASLGFQLWAIVRLLRHMPGAEVFGRRVAIGHAVLALALLFAMVCMKEVNMPATFAAWMAMWTSPYGLVDWDFNPLPLLILAQWVFLGPEHETTFDRWRGIAIGCLGYSALLGTWVFSPFFAGGWSILRWSGDGLPRFENVTMAFFNIGVGIHLIALWQVGVRGRFAWAWTGLVGFGCLISGSVLSLGFNGDVLAESRPIYQIGWILHMGWFGLGSLLPPICYVLIATASLVLLRESKARLIAARNRTDMGWQTFPPDQRTSQSA